MIGPSLHRRRRDAKSPPLADLVTCMGDLSRCNALRSVREIEASSHLVELLGLPSHHDPRKNWDTLKCYHSVLRSTGPGTPVLDVGGSPKSPILRWLGLAGYSELYACNLDAKLDRGSTAVRFSVQDLCRTSYEDRFFGAVTSISVIEHGVPLDRYLAEMSRILAPRGVLLTSTDYWSEPVDCSGIFPYGPGMPEMKVFRREELEAFAAMAPRFGFRLSSPLELDTEDRVIHWERVDRRYTFAFIALEKQD